MPTAEDTYSYGLKLGEKLQSGSVVLLNGELGAGKTALAQGLVRGLGSDDVVSSPTFALVNTYSGRLLIHHFDLYRLNQSIELEDIGFLEMVESAGVTIIEWAEKFVEWMPQNAIKITLTRLSNIDGRQLTIEANDVDISD